MFTSLFPTFKSLKLTVTIPFYSIFEIFPINGSSVEIPIYEAFKSLIYSEV